MLKQSKDINQNYAARILRVESIEPIPEAHSIVRAVLGTNKVVVSKDTKVGDLVVYFPVGSVIHSKYLSFHHLYQDYTLNANKEEYETAYRRWEAFEGSMDEKEVLRAGLKRLVGMFDKTGRVRMLKLRGQYSEGYVAPIDTLISVWPELGKLNWEEEIGTVFDTVDKELICWKYVPPVKSVEPRVHKTGRHRKEAKFDRLVPNQFAFHYDTNHLERNAQFFNPDDLITLTVKEHGTAFEMANILTYRPLRFTEKIRKLLGMKVDNRVYGNVFSSRRVIQNRYINPNFRTENSFYGSGVYECVNRDLFKYVPEGMTVYGEIVGYKEGTNQCIQSPKGIDHDYGCKPGQWSFMPYRITMTKPDGLVSEWSVLDVISWTLMVKELLAPEDRHKLHPMTLLYEGKAGDMYNLWSEIQKQVTKKNWEKAKEVAAEDSNLTHLPSYLENLNSYRTHCWQIEWIERMKQDKEMLGFELPEPLCNNKKAPREGVVLRLTGDFHSEAWKLKTLAHKNLSQKAMDSGEVDIDDVN